MREISQALMFLAKDMTKHPESNGERGSQIGARFPQKRWQGGPEGEPIIWLMPVFRATNKTRQDSGYTHTHTLGRCAAYANFGSWDPKIADRSCRSRRRCLGPTQHGGRDAAQKCVFSRSICCCTAIRSPEERSFWRGEKWEIIAILVICVIRYFLSAVGRHTWWIIFYYNFWKVHLWETVKS